MVMPPGMIWSLSVKLLCVLKLRECELSWVVGGKDPWHTERRIDGRKSLVGNRNIGNY